MIVGPSYQARLPTPFSVLGIRMERECLVGIDFLPSEERTLLPSDPFARRVCEQIEAYLCHADFDFDLPLALRGTEHQMNVWRALMQIPRGAGVTYGDVAKAIDSSPRAVGRACGDNPIPIVVPCHRVVAKQGTGGFMHQSGGEALAIKDWLLRHERNPG
jgi:methylated-DNA-[protein]-cysteine S-methyltransferase